MMPSDNNHNNQGKCKTMKRQRKHEFIKSVQPTERKTTRTLTQNKQEKKNGKSSAKVQTQRQTQA